MNYRKFLFGLLVMIVIGLFLFMFLGCGTDGGDCGINIGCFACGVGCNECGGCLGRPYMDGCTVIGCSVCDACGSCVGCGLENGSLYFSANTKEQMATQRIEFRVTADGFNVSDSVFIEITSDSTGSADLERVDGGFVLTADDAGTVTVEAVLGDYSNSTTFTFVTIESILNSFSIDLSTNSSDKFTNIPYTLSVSGNHNLVSISEGVLEYSMPENSAGASISGNQITATSAGTVTVRASFTWQSRTFTDEISMVFSDSSIEVYTQSETEPIIGHSVPLFFNLITDNDYNSSNGYNLQYSVTTGAGEFWNDGANYYLVPHSVGEVGIKLIYTSGALSLSATTSVNVRTTDFEIMPTEDTAEELYVNHDVKLTATGELVGFIAEDVIYEVVSGAATITEKSYDGVAYQVLTVTAPGKVVIKGTYDYHGTVITSKLWEHEFEYDQYTISSPEDLHKMDDKGEEFNLIADLDLSSYTSWTPISNFSGILNGNGHKITGLKLSVSSSESYKGLFSVISGTVKDLTVSGNVTANGQASYIGILCGENRGTIQNVTVTGSVSAQYSDFVGGVAGSSTTPLFQSVNATVSVRGRNYTGALAGAIVYNGGYEGTVLSAITVTGTVNGENQVGGIAGSFKIENAPSTVLLNDFENNTTVEALFNSAGGLFGELVIGSGSARARIYGAKNNCTVKGVKYVGGLVGYAPGVSEIVESQNLADITGETYVGGFVGSASNALLSGLTNERTITGKAYIGGIAGMADTLQRCHNKGTITSIGYINEDNMSVSYIGGIAGKAKNVSECTNDTEINVSTGGAYVGGIAGYINASDSASMAISGNINNKNVIGTAYVGGIAGILSIDNKDSEITVTAGSNVNKGIIQATGNYAGGIFGKTEGNVSINDAKNENSVFGKEYVGGVVGAMTDRASGITLADNKGSVSGTRYVGGIVGDAQDASLYNLTNSGSVMATVYFGGVAGIAGRLNACENTGTVSAQSYDYDSNAKPISYAGGIAGYACGAKDCKNRGNVNLQNGGSYVGGIVGYLNAYTSTQDSIMGNINEAQIVGNDSPYLGGIAGALVVQTGYNTQTITVKNNTNSGEIKGNGNKTDYVGGLFGLANGSESFNGGGYTFISITECKNSAAIVGNNYVGGIVGASEIGLTEIVRSTNENNVAGTLYVGGFAGLAEGTKMVSLTNTKLITGKAYIGGIAGKAGVFESCTNEGSLQFTGKYKDEQVGEYMAYAGGIAGIATQVISCKNANAIDATIAGGAVGGIVGYLTTTYGADNSGNENNGMIVGTAYIGGIAGLVEVNSDTPVIIANNTNNGQIQATGDGIGGIFGAIMGRGNGVIRITDSKNTAAITGMNRVGGIVGCALENVAEISACENIANIAGQLFVGGFAGYAQVAKLISLQNSNTISGKAYVGGIAGLASRLDSCENRGDIVTNGTNEENGIAVACAGGIVGAAQHIVNCQNYASISINTGYYVGGIAGRIDAIRSTSDPITGNKNYGDIYGVACVGGIAGGLGVSDTESSETVIVEDNTNSSGIYATGNCVGGIFGEMNGANYSGYTSIVRIINCSNESDVEGADYVAGIVGLAGEFVDFSDSEWETNDFGGEITASGTHTGEYYCKE